MLLSCAPFIMTAVEEGVIDPFSLPVKTGDGSQNNLCYNRGTLTIPGLTYMGSLFSTVSSSFLGVISLSLSAAIHFLFQLEKKKKRKSMFFSVFRDLNTSNAAGQFCHPLSQGTVK